MNTEIFGDWTITVMSFLAFLILILVIFLISQERKIKKKDKAFETLDKKMKDVTFFLESTGQLTLYRESEEAIDHILKMPNTGHHVKKGILKQYLDSHKDSIAKGVEEVTHHIVDPQEIQINNDNESNP